MATLINNRSTALTAADKITNMSILAIDKETTGLDPYKHKVLLSAVGDANDQFVFQLNIPEVIKVYKEIIEDITSRPSIKILGAHIKFDNKFSIVHYNIPLVHPLICNIFDVIVAEQRIYQNMPISYSLGEITRRYLGYIPVEMDKSIRNDFINADWEKFNPLPRHIDYAAGDIAYLFTIYEKQKELIDKYKLNFLLEEIEFPLVGVLSRMEIEGIDFDTERWRNTYKKAKDIKFDYECKLDEEFRKIRNLVLRNDPLTRAYISNGIYDNPRLKHPEIINVGLFGEPVSHKALIGNTKPVKTNKHNINYNSTEELKRIAAYLGIPLPTQKGEYIIPIIIEFVKTYPNGSRVVKEKISNAYNKFTTKKEYLDQWLLKHDNSIFYDFIKLLREQRDYTNKVTTFGENFITNYVNPVTNKIHTIFRQCSEDKGANLNEEGKTPINGRLSSGDAANGYPNMQNIPRDKEYRKSFIAPPGYKILTCDLSGAEVTTMAGKAQDDALRDHVLAGTIHDYIATNGWQLILKSRGVPNWKDFIVSKTVNPDKRQIGKNMHFGVFYGLMAKKGAETLNVTQNEAQLYINFIKQAFPKTVATLNGYAKQAIKNGYLIIDDRTNARIWFPEIIQHIKECMAIFKANQLKDADQQEDYPELPFMVKIAVEGKARNIPISGTQANMLKEAMVVIDRWHIKNNIDAKILLQVHDELVIKFKEELIDTEFEFTYNSGEKKFLKYPDFIVETMCEVANRYLKGGFKMLAEYHVGDTWIK